MQRFAHIALRLRSSFIYGTSMRGQRRTVGYSRILGRTAIAAALMAGFAVAPGICQAQLIVGGSPIYDPTTGTGSLNGSFLMAPGNAVNESGTAVGQAQKYVDGISLGLRAVRWDASSASATELGTLGTSSTGLTSAQAAAVNNSGTAVGFAEKFALGSSLGVRAVRWDASGTTAMELENLSTDSAGITNSHALHINDAGIIVGRVDKYVAGQNLGSRAVRWDPSGTAITELESLGFDDAGGTFASANLVNNVGTVVGGANKYLSGRNVGLRAVRWEAGGVAVTELGNLGTSNAGIANTISMDLNDSGVIVGFADKYVSGVNFGSRAVRWDASGTVATELGNLGTLSSGFTTARANAVNNFGTAVGAASKYAAGRNLGLRAVRWNAGSVAAMELENLGSGNTYAFDVNDAGTSVGDAEEFVAGVSQGLRAVLWLPDASIINLNELGVAPDPSGGTWLLRFARTITSDGWVSGIGTFHPVVGDPYQRAWVAQVGLGGAWTNAFTGNLNGTWGRGPQWSTGAPATQVGAARFDAPGAYTVSLDRDETTRSIAIVEGSVTFNFNGHSLTSLLGTTVASGAALGGAGTIVGNLALSNGARLAPGASAGTLNVDGRLSLNATSIADFELNGADATVGNDLVMTRDLTLDGVVNIAETIPRSFLSAKLDDQWRLFNYSGSLINNGLLIAATPSLPNPSWRYVIDAATPGQVNLRITNVPEPTAIFMAFVACLAVGRQCRRAQPLYPSCSAR